MFFEDTNCLRDRPVAVPERPATARDRRTMEIECRRRK